MNSLRASGERNRIPGWRGPLPMKERIVTFWSYVPERPVNQCWNWNGCIDKKSGYGVFYCNSTRIGSHRFSYLIANGSLPDLFICHKCDNRLCVNPDHLFPGTIADNNRDAWAKGRMQKLLDSIPNRRLTAEIVQRVRKAKAATSLQQKQLAESLGLESTLVHAALRKGRWKSIPWQ